MGSSPSGLPNGREATACRSTKTRCERARLDTGCLPPRLSAPLPALPTQCLCPGALCSGLSPLCLLSASVLVHSALVCPRSAYSVPLSWCTLLGSVPALPTQCLCPGALCSGLSPLCPLCASVLVHSALVCPRSAHSVPLSWCTLLPALPTQCLCPGALCSPLCLLSASVLVHSAPRSAYSVPLSWCTLLGSVPALPTLCLCPGALCSGLSPLCLLSASVLVHSALVWSAFSALNCSVPPLLCSVVLHPDLP